MGFLQTLKRNVKESLHFLLGTYLILSSYQQLIVKYGVHYDRRRYRRIYENFSKYALHQYRTRYPGKEHKNRYADYPLTLPLPPAYLRFQKYFYLILIIRCFVPVFFKWTVDTETKRIWMGTAFTNRETPFVEVIVGFWSAICYLYLQFSLSSSLLDYKFLVILEISPKRPEYLRAADLGLTKEQLFRLYRFRQMALFFFHQTMASICVLIPATGLFVYLKVPFYATHPLHHLFWSILLCYWSYATTDLYMNLIYFIIVANYLQLKQKSYATYLLRSLTQLLTNQRKVATLRTIVPKRKRVRPGKALPDSKPYMDRLVRQALGYTYLQDELADYNHFWCLYLSLIFVFYVLIICFLLFTIFYTDLIAFGKFLFLMATLVNVAILMVIILFCDKITTQNEALSRRFTSLLGETAQLHLQLPVPQIIKMNNMSSYLKDTPSGFSLLNGYVVTNDTLRLLIVTITSYFFLIIKKITQP